MLTLLVNFSEQVSVFNVFRYITFRTGGAMFTAALFVFMFGPAIIDLLRVKQGKGQPIRADGPQTHLQEGRHADHGRPDDPVRHVTAPSLLWADCRNVYVWVVLLVTLGFGAIGFYDDYLKVTKQHANGLFRQGAPGHRSSWSPAIAAWAIMHNGRRRSRVITDASRSSRTCSDQSRLVLHSLCVLLVIVGAGNAVNLTDGLDGLAIVPVMIAAATFGLIAYLFGNAIFADYLQIHFVPGTGELAVICGALIGAGLGFLWFNAPPATIFMGDTGSLALGGADRHDRGRDQARDRAGHRRRPVRASRRCRVIIQVGFFKLTGKRVFLMAPIHHHFEKLGWTESQVVIRFWIIAVILALVGLSTLKLR